MAVAVDVVVAVAGHSGRAAGRAVKYRFLDGGKMGGGQGAVRVFQEFFVDIDFPATLTRGDEVNFPVAVYNYLDTAQTVRAPKIPGSSV